MAIRVIAKVRGEVFGLLAVAAACDPSVDLDGLPCNAEGQCLDGYSCLAGLCVADASVGRGDTCAESQQCDGYPDTVCGQGPWVCSAACQQPWASGLTASCRTWEYCRPNLGDDSAGICAPSECDTTAECNRRPSDISGALSCVTVTPSARACLPTCSISVVDGVYDDSCDGADEATLCQAIGPITQQTLVCLPVATTLRAETGQACDASAQPCGRGDVCHDGLCHRYCDSAANDGGGANPYCPVDAIYCRAAPSEGPQVYGVCSSI